MADFVKIPFRDRHPFLLNSLLMIPAFVVFVIAGLLFIDVFVAHGKETQVPELRNLPLDQAIEKLEEAGLKWEIVDSTNYNESFRPGVITDQEPKAGSYIKAIRPVYLYVNAMHPRIVSFPKLQDGSLSMAMVTLRDMGFKSIEVDTVESRYENVVSVLVNGRKIAPGQGVAINARIKLSVGDGSLKDNMPEEFLPAEMLDSIAKAQAESGEYVENVTK